MVINRVLLFSHSFKVDISKLRPYLQFNSGAFARSIMGDLLLCKEYDRFWLSLVV